MIDPIRPAYYQVGGIDTGTLAGGLTFWAGNALKYIVRACRTDGVHKAETVAGRIRDLTKARECIGREIMWLQAEQIEAGVEPTGPDAESLHARYFPAEEDSVEVWAAGVEAAPAETEPDTTPGAVLPVVADDRYMPTRAHPGDAGLDLRAVEEVRLYRGGHARVRTGVQVAIPEGHVGYITPRSGLAARKGVTVLNAPGTIDSGYRGEIEVILVNHGPMPVWIEGGDRIAQLVIHPIITPKVKQVDALPATERGEGGFGSTGA
ncbi:dUTP diphosphatase [Corynebacterium mastitidis]|uniref:dUTP diphosphatase n=1 Tax=Corynebacterium mastitidis TaxID=161890 RepID=UPI00254EEA65|nr:dUTP diphosphatase [Corynebacterium mastitidis]MDK8450978.1 dUTP diphosphatase [Corynebacterium mastitidis]